MNPVYTVAVALTLYAGSVSAHYGGGFALLGLGALGVGLVAGFVSGFKGLSHSVGLGGSLLFIFVATFLFIVFLGSILEALFWTIVMVPLVGLLPLAVTYFPAYALSAAVKRRLAPTDHAGHAEAKDPQSMSTNSTPHTDAREAPAPASDSGARTRGRER